MQEVRSVEGADVAGKRVVVHTDFDVPIIGGTVANDMRIKAALPTIALLREKGAKKIILISKLGRPGGKVVESLRMAPVLARLQELTNSTDIELRENLRFDPREEANDEGFAKELAALGDVYVNEAFADSHRAHASIVGIPKFLPSFAGLRFVEEVRNLSAALTPPPHSLALIGGAKFETKVPLISKLLPLYAEVLLGGALANDVLKARGLPFGSSLVSATPAPFDVAGSERLAVPTDAIFLETGSNAERTGSVVDIRTNESIADIGPSTAAAWSSKISKAPFVLWNGPVGIYEQGYRDGTDTLAAALVASSARAVVGGGDTAAALEKHRFDPAKVFLSTGGGAMLEFLTAGTLPGIEALQG